MNDLQEEAIKYARDNLTPAEQETVWLQIVTNAFLIGSLRMNERAVRLAKRKADPSDCEQLGMMDWETGVRECALDTRGGSCLCIDRQECAEELAKEILALMPTGQRGT